MGIVMRRLWVLACIVVPLIALAVPVVFISAIWTQSGRLGGVGSVLAVCAVITVPTFWIWTVDAKPEAPLPRSHRKALRIERDRIRMEAAIAEAEREAGIR